MQPNRNWKQTIVLVVTWRGGQGIDVLSVAHNEQRIPAEARVVHADRSSARIEYQVERSRRHRVNAAFSFIGDQRTNLTLHCMVDGVLAGGPVQTRNAEHRSEARGARTPFSG